MTAAAAQLSALDELAAGVASVTVSVAGSLGEAVSGCSSAVVGPGAADGLAPVVALAEGPAVVVAGLGLACGLGWAAGAAARGVTPGWLLPPPRWNTKPTHPPRGMLSESTPDDAYTQVPLVPFDQNNPQYASAGGMLTQEVDGLPLTWHTAPG